jgi:hypothetical protein
MFYLLIELSTGSPFRVPERILWGFHKMVSQKKQKAVRGQKQ